jgi:hypothetical protein
VTVTQDLPRDPRASTESLRQAAWEALRVRLPPKWTVQTVQSNTGDEQLVIGDAGGQQRPFVVEAQLRFAPSDAKTLLGGSLTRRLLRTSYYTPLLVIAPFLGPRTRQLLIDEGHNYVDLTGNIHITVETPGLFIHTQGEDRDPVRSSPSTRGLTGVAAGQITRYLIDHTPPYTATEVADATGVNLGYVSRIFESLSTEALIDRLPRGPVTDVDRNSLIRYRAQALGLTPGVSDPDDQLEWLRSNDPAWTPSS